MDQSFIPPATAQKLEELHPEGTRHKAKIAITMSLIGNGMSPAAVFEELKAKFPSARESEIRGVIDWVLKAGPSPSTLQGLGGVRYQPRQYVPPKPARTIKEQVEWWTSGARVSPESLIALSPTPIPAEYDDQAALAIGSLFSDEDSLNIVTLFTFDDKKNKANPSGGGKTMKRNQWVEWFFTKGVPQSEAGAWIRINPSNPSGGTGSDGAITNSDITSFKYLLVEADDVPIAMQLAFYQRLQLPISAIILSGGDSAHAWVKVNASDGESYSRIATRLLDSLKFFGIDQANKNCSRLCRLPGAKRTIGAVEDGYQRLLWLSPTVAGITEESLKIFEQSLEFPAIEEKPLMALAKSSVERYADLFKNRGKLGVPYGIAGLDNISGGMKSGQTIVVAGITGGGKSTLGLHMVKSALSAGYGVLLFSLEMDREELFDLMMSDRCGIDRNKFNNGYFHESDFGLLKEGLQKIKDLPLFIEDTAITSADQIRVRSLQLIGAKKIGLIVVDYIQFVSPEASRETREQQVAQISHKLRALARETRLPMVILSQLNDEGKLRESRVISHNANVVITVDQDGDVFTAKVVKGRGIPTGEYRMDFNRRLARLTCDPIPSVVLGNYKVPYAD